MSDVCLEVLIDPDMTVQELATMYGYPNADPELPSAVEPPPPEKSEQDRMWDALREAALT